MNYRMKPSGKGWSTHTRLLPRYHSLCTSKAALVVTIFLGSFGWPELSVAATSALNPGIEETQGTLLEIKDRHRIALLILRSSVIDVSESDDPVVAEALAAEPREARRHRHAYGSITRKLNEYIRKYRSLRPVNEIAQADFIIYFKLVEYRRLLNGYYPYGELFIIVNPRPEERRPARVIWKTKKVTFAEDAVRDFLKQLRRVRGER